MGGEPGNCLVFKGCDLESWKPKSTASGSHVEQTCDAWKMRMGV